MKSEVQFDSNAFLEVLNFTQNPNIWKTKVCKSLTINQKAEDKQWI